MASGRLRRRGLFGALLAVAMVIGMLPAAAGADDASAEINDPDDISVVTLVIPDQNRLTSVVDAGFDLDHNLERVGDGYTVTAIVSNLDIATLEDIGVEIEVNATPAELAAHHDALLAERAASEGAASSRASAFNVEDTDTVVIARADWFTNQAARTLSVEAKTSDGTAPANANPVMTLRWDAGPGTEIGDGGETNMSAFVDAGEYMYHRTSPNLASTLGDTMPTRVSVTSANGGYAEGDVTEWLPTDFPPPGNRYFSGFFNAYKDPQELTEYIVELHERFPTLTEIIDLPYQTNGYRRNAAAVLGDSAANQVGVTSNDWGHEGGNDITVQLAGVIASNSPLFVSVVDDTNIFVYLETNADQAVVSTAAEVVAAINAHDEASELVHAYTYRGNDGEGVVAPAGATLSDGLTAPDRVERAPFQVKAIRIGAVRDGSKTGILGYSQEHAREWQTPMVSIETATRLLENYHTDTDTRRLVDNLDIFIVPTVNPDGGHYSHHDFASQRKNMTNHCPITGNYDFNARNTWGVDNNRNYTAYSSHDGYSGGSTGCTSGTYMGPAELSEPESANIHWLPGAYPNIKFSMNIHSSGNYYMWSPGSYATPGRISAPRPSFGEENFFWYMADRILTEIKQHRGLSVTPARTGPIADVLYSAAGNSGDMMWYDFGIFGFSFEVGTSFQPSWGDGTGEAYNQMMEFSNGLIELFEVALTWTRDRYAPTTWINEDISEPSSEPVGITFGYSEPVEIYYTTDGSNPTEDSAKYGFAGIREGGETLWFEETTTIKWYSVDMAGNVEGKYHPDRDNPRTATIIIED